METFLNGVSLNCGIDELLHLNQSIEGITDCQNFFIPCISRVTNSEQKIPFFRVLHFYIVVCLTSRQFTH